MLIRDTHMHMQSRLLGQGADFSKTFIGVFIKANGLQSGLKLPPGNHQDNSIETIRLDLLKIPRSPANIRVPVIQRPCIAKICDGLEIFGVGNQRNCKSTGEASDQQQPPQESPAPSSHSIHPPTPFTPNESIFWGERSPNTPLDMNICIKNSSKGSLRKTCKHKGTPLSGNLIPIVVVSHDPQDGICDLLRLIMHRNNGV